MPIFPTLPERINSWPIHCAARYADAFLPARLVGCSSGVHHGPALFNRVANRLFHIYMSPPLPLLSLLKDASDPASPRWRSPSSLANDLDIAIGLGLVTRLARNPLHGRSQMAAHQHRIGRLFCIRQTPWLLQNVVPTSLSPSTVRY